MRYVYVMCLSKILAHGSKSLILGIQAKRVITSVEWRTQCRNIGINIKKGCNRCIEVRRGYSG